jgi:hypothetical protein
MTTLHTLLTQHLHRHAYRRGIFKGAAPLNQRWARHKRVHHNPITDTMDVIIYNTDVVSAHRDGSITLRTNGWNSQTTKDGINRVLYTLRSRLYIYSLRHRGVSQWVLSTEHGTYAFYDGMVLSPELKPCHPKPFKYRAINAFKSTAFTKDPTTKEFFQTLPLLHAALPDTRQAHLNWYAYEQRGSALRKLIADPAQWADLVEAQAYYAQWPGAPKHPDHKDVARLLKQYAKEDLYEVHDTPYTLL